MLRILSRRKSFVLGYSHSLTFSNSRRSFSGDMKPYSFADKKLWELGKFNHVAIAVPDLEKASYFYKEVLQGKVSEPVPLPDHGVTTVFVDLGNTKIELLHPLNESSPIANFLKKSPAGGMHHICLEVSDIRKAQSSLTESGLRCLSKEPKIGAHGKLVCFLHPKDCNGVLVSSFFGARS